MRSIIATSALALAIAAPGLAAAQGLKFSAGATLASQYVADGIKQTNGIAFQPWVEGEVGGFYFGAWLSNTDKAIVGSSSEIDLYVGYRGEVGMFSYDVGYTRYYYQNPKVDCCGDIIVQLGVAPTDKLSLGTKVKYNPSKTTNPTKAYNLSISADYALTDKFSMGAVYGKVTKGGMKYWSLGGSYAINDDLALGLSWNDTDTTKGIAVLALDYAFSFK